MTSWILVCFPLLIFFHQTCGLLHVQNGRKFQTSKFLFLGSPFMNIENVSFVWIPDNKVCSVGEDVVGDIIVVTRLLDNECNLDELLARLERANALMLVVQTFTAAPGMLSFFKSSWGGGRKGKMHIIEVERGFNPQSYAGFRVSVDDSHSRDFETCFTSWMWTSIMRTTLPIFALHTSLLGLQVAKKSMFINPIGPIGSRSRPRPIEVFVGVSEIISNVLIGVALASGTYGPMTAPSSFHFSLYFLFSGNGLFVTFLLAILARGKIRALRGIPAQDILKTKGRFIFLAGSCFFAVDVIQIFLTISGGSIRTKLLLVLMCAPCLIAGHVIVGALFFVEVWRM
jgi:hypothetical protein